MKPAAVAGVFVNLEAILENPVFRRTAYPFRNPRVNLIFSLKIMKPVLLAGSCLLLLSSCSITQEGPVNIKGVPNVLSSTASQQLQRAGEEACRKAGYSNFSSNILVFSTDVSYRFTGSWNMDVDRVARNQKDIWDDTEPPNVRMKGKMMIARTRNYRIPGIILPLFRWTGGTIYVECPVDILYYEPDSSFREML